MLKSGTRIQIETMDAAFNRKWEAAKIVRWLKVMGPREKMPGWYPIKFADGGILMCHESGFRVVDSRA